MLILVSGGSASGKSEFAEGLVTASGLETRAYLATMQVWDAESERRVERHRRMRAGKGFVTVEGDKVPQTWIERRPDRRFLQINSKPLTVPHEVNSWYVAQVL